MTFAAVGSGVSVAATFSLNPVNVGDLFIATVAAESTTVFAIGITSTNITWKQVGKTFSGPGTFSGNAAFYNVWLGKSTATGAATQTVVFNTTPTPVIRGWAQEYSSTLGAWVLDGVQGNFAANGVAAFPSLTPTQAGDIYWAWGLEAGFGSAGSTSGFTYFLDASSSEGCWNAACTSAAQAPNVGSDSREGIAVLIREVTPTQVVAVTATQGGSTANGMGMRIRVLTGAAAAALQTGGSASAGNSGTASVSITTTQAGSLVYGALGNQGDLSGAEPSTTIVDDFQDNPQGQFYGSFRTTAVTGTPGSTLVGSTVNNAFGSIAAQEILPAGTIAEDPSGPSFIGTTSATTLTSANFAPPPGSLIVVMVQCDGSASGTETCTVTGGGLTWIQKANTSGISGSLYAGVWIAQVPLWTVLQSAGAPTASSTTASASFGNKLSAGTTILAFIANNVPVTSVKDTAGNSLTQLTDIPNAWASGNGHLTIYGMDTPVGDVGATTTITVTVGSTSFFGVVIQEVSGLAPVASILDGTAGSDVQTALPNTSPTYSSSAAGEYLVGFLGDNGLGILGPSAAAGYTVDANSVINTADCDCVVAYKSSSNGSESCVFSETGGTNNLSHAVLLVAFRLAGAVASAPLNVSRYPQRAIASQLRSQRVRQHTNFVPSRPPLIWDPPRFIQRAPTAGVRRTHGVVAPTGWPVKVQPPYLPREARPQPILKPAGIIRSRDRSVVPPTGWPVPVQPPELPHFVRRYSRPLYQRRDTPLKTFPLVLTPAPFAWNYIRRIAKPPYPRRGVVAPTGWPVPVQPPMTSISVRQRFARVLLFRHGNVVPTGWPVPVQPPNIPDGLRFIGPRRRFLRSGVVPPTNLPETLQIPSAQRQAQSRRRFLRYGGIVPPTGWPVPIQPPERMSSVRRWSRPLLMRRGVTRNVSPPPVTVNPPISWSARRWSRPPWPRRGIVAATGWPVPVQPPERMQPIRERIVRILLPRRGVVSPGPVPPPPILNPFIESEAKRIVRIPARRGSAVLAPEPIPGPIPSVERNGRYSKIIRARRTAPGTPGLPLPQYPLNPASERRKRRLIPFRRGNPQPDTGLPVLTQPPEKMQAVRRWSKPLFARRGTVAPSAPSALVVIEVKLPVWLWISQLLPEVTVTQLVPYVSITVSIPLEGEKEV